MWPAAWVLATAFLWTGSMGQLASLPPLEGPTTKSGLAVPTKTSSAERMWESSSPVQEGPTTKSRTVAPTTAESSTRKMESSSPVEEGPTTKSRTEAPTTAESSTRRTESSSPVPDGPTTESDSPDEDRAPWWWWIPVVGGSTLILVVLLWLSASLCCRRPICPLRRRVHWRSPVVTKRNSSNGGGVPMRRQDSSRTMRYLHNMVSVFSWGSDFEDSPDETRSTSPATPSPRASHVYVNADTPPHINTDGGLDAPPPLPQKKNKPGHYVNVNLIDGRLEV